jgi:hypothetical protein
MAGNANVNEVVTVNLGCDALGKDNKMINMTM